MSEKLISAADLIANLESILSDYTSNGLYPNGFDIESAIDALVDAPAVDAVEVVRCKDCEFCRDSFDPWTKTSVQVCGYVGFNPVQSSQVSDNDFCSHGERRDENAID